jgi:hypothetical protein
MIANFFSGEAARIPFMESMPLLEKAVDHADGDFDIVDLMHQVLADKAVLGVVQSDDGDALMVGVFEFIYYPQKTSVNIMALAGQDIRNAMAVYWEQFQEFCRRQGADFIEARCRPAMVKLLSNQGFRPSYQIVRHDL